MKALKCMLMVVGAVGFLQVGCSSDDTAGTDTGGTDGETTTSTSGGTGDTGDTTTTDTGGDTTGTTDGGGETTGADDGGGDTTTTTGGPTGGDSCADTLSCTFSCPTGVDGAPEQACAAECQAAAGQDAIAGITALNDCATTNCNPEDPTTGQLCLFEECFSTVHDCVGGTLNCSGMLNCIIACQGPQGGPAPPEAEMIVCQNQCLFNAAEFKWLDQFIGLNNCIGDACPEGSPPTCGQLALGPDGACGGHLAACQTNSEPPVDGGGTTDGGDTTTDGGDTGTDGGVGSTDAGDTTDGGVGSTDAGDTGSSDSTGTTGSDEGSTDSTGGSVGSTDEGDATGGSSDSTDGGSTGGSADTTDGGSTGSSTGGEDTGTTDGGSSKPGVQVDFAPAHWLIHLDARWLSGLDWF
ncbi:MAG: collagen type VII alpha [Myxococcota bacterium]|jgi:collagen type VII alpha